MTTTGFLLASDVSSDVNSFALDSYYFDTAYCRDLQPFVAVCEDVHTVGSN